MAAYKLPKETDEEKAARSAEIQKSLKYAIQTPYDIVVLSGKAISLLGEILANGNQNAITDIGVKTMQFSCTDDMKAAERSVATCLMSTPFLLTRFQKPSKESAPLPSPT